MDHRLLKKTVRSVRPFAICPTFRGNDDGRHTDILPFTAMQSMALIGDSEQGQLCNN